MLSSTAAVPSALEAEVANDEQTLAVFAVETRRRGLEEITAEEVLTRAPGGS